MQTVFNCDECDGEGWIEVYPPHGISAYTGAGDPDYEYVACPECAAPYSLFTQLGGCSWNRNRQLAGFATEEQAQAFKAQFPGWQTFLLAEKE